MLNIKENSLPICFASNEKYLPYCGVTIQSILCNIDVNDKFAIYILHNGISEQKFTKIISMQTDNVSIQFIDVRPYLNFDEKLLKTVAHFSVEMYNRILIPIIFKEYDKVLYVDCDLVFNCNPKQLFNIDLKDNLLAAVQDIDFYIRDDYSKTLPYVKPQEYFNSGVLLMNISELNKFCLFDKFIKLLQEENSYQFPDQDILNILCNGRIFYLDYIYNFQYGAYLMYIRNLWVIYQQQNKDDDKKNLLNQFMLSVRHPLVVHYTGTQKPWLNTDTALSEYFIFYLMQSPFYKEIIADLLDDIYVSKLKITIWKIKSKIPHKKQHYYINKLKDLDTKHKFFQEMNCSL